MTVDDEWYLDEAGLRRLSLEGDRHMASLRRQMRRAERRWQIRRWWRSLWRRP